MKTSSIICTTVGALVLTGIATTMPAEARHFGPGFAGRSDCGSSRRWRPFFGVCIRPRAPFTLYGSYEGGPGYYAPYGHPYEVYGTYEVPARWTAFL